MARKRKRYVVVAQSPTGEARTFEDQSASDAAMLRLAYLELGWHVDVLLSLIYGEA